MPYFRSTPVFSQAIRSLAVLVAISAGTTAVADLPEKLPNHPVLADDGDVLKASEPLVFAILGNTRDALPSADLPAGASLVKGVREAVIADIATESALPGGPNLLILLGDHTRKGDVASFKAMDKQLAAILDGAKPPKGSEAKQLRAMPLAGDHEGMGDERYFSFGDMFPKVGADIGFGRVASWYAYDIQTNGKTWRFMVVDPRKEALGSRWTEQLGWIKRTTDDSKFDFLMLFMHDPVFDLGGRNPEMNKGGGSLELLEVIEDAIGVQRLRAVVSAGHHTNQVLMPDGPRGALVLGAGGSGPVQDDLKRWGPADAAGRAADVNLEPIFDLALLDQVDRWNRDVGLPEVAVDEAKARGTFEGFTAAYNARHFPIAGWWTMKLDGGVMVLDFHYRKLDGSFANIYRVQHQPEVGWIPSRPQK